MSTVAADAGRRPPRAKTGLALLIVALVAALLAYALTGLGANGRAPRNLELYGTIYVLAAVGCWVAMRFVARNADPVLFPTAAVIAGLGLAMLFRLLPAHIAEQQGVWLLVGMVAFVVVLLLIRDDRQLDAYTYTIGLAGIGLLLLPIVPGIGYSINGARLWARVGPLAFQPAEFGKILLVVFLASYLSGTRELLAAGVGRFGLPRGKDLGPLLLAWAAALLVLFLEQDLGASLLFFSVFVVMIWVASGRVGYLVIGLLLAALGAAIGYLLFSHVQQRVDFWLHALEPSKVHEFGYGQLAQSWFALASGGLVGTGLGQGSPDLIPYRASDFILSAFGEELGMLGTTAILLLYLALIGRGLRVAIERTDSFGKLLATGLTATIGLQTFVIAAGVTRLIPLTGVPLPLMSYGGSSRLATMIVLALLIRVSAGPWIHRAKSPPRPPTPTPREPTPREPAAAATGGDAAGG